MRYALYFTPPAHDPLTLAAAQWLGRSAYSGEAMEPPEICNLGLHEIAYHTALPRRCGFHATLKAPFRLAPDETEASLRAALDRFAEATPPVVIPRLVVGQIDGFFALVPETQFAQLNDFAGEVVRAFDPFRAPLTEVEIERRGPDALKPDEFRNLCQWGYPYVFDTFRFHMTLSGRVGPQESPRLRAAIDGLFADVLRQPVPVDALTLFVESEPGAPFMVLSHHALGRGPARKTA